MQCGCAPRGISIAGHGRTVHADDGFALRAYTLYQVVGDSRAHPTPSGVLFYIQGSDDRSVLGATGELAGAAAMGLDVACVERRGVLNDGQVDRTVAKRFATKGTRIADHLALIDDYLGEHPGIEPVIVMGTSEGADIATGVAAREQRITHLILLGSGGGWSQADEFRHMLRTRPGSMPGVSSAEDLEAKFDEIRGAVDPDPRADEEWFGHPYRRWATYLFDPPVNELLTLDIPILLIHGEADQSVPVGSARALRDAFAAAGKDNLRYHEYPGVDHTFLHVESGTHVRAWVEIDCVRWLAAHEVLDEARAVRFISRVRANHPELDGLAGSGAR